MQRRISVRVFGAEWTLRRRGPEAPFWSFQGERVLRERGKFEIPLSLSGSLVTFCPHRKSLAHRRNIQTIHNLFRRPDDGIGPYRTGRKPYTRAHNVRPFKIILNPP